MSQTAKHIPLRKCVVCKAEGQKDAFLRVVRYRGEFSVDNTGKAEGRGAYICKNADCVKRLRKSRRLEKAFRTQIPQEIYDTLEGLSF